MRSFCCCALLLEQEFSGRSALAGSGRTKQSNTSGMTSSHASVTCASKYAAQMYERVRSAVIIAAAADHYACHMVMICSV